MIDPTWLKAAAETVYAHMTPTAQINWPLLSARAGCEVYVKHENHTPIGAFKVRGGILYMDRLRQEKPDVKAVITATRGNHGQSIACAAARMGMAARIVVPEGNNPEKNAAIRAYGADLVEVGHDFQAAREAVAKMLAEEQGLHMIPAFHPILVSGVATYSLEFLMLVPDLDTVYVPIGMGSGICGMIAARHSLKSSVSIVGVVAEKASAYAQSFRAGHVVDTETADTVADGLACRTPDPEAFEAILANVDRVVTVGEDEIMQAMKIYLTDTHNLAEGASAAALAALLQERDRLKGKRVGVIHTGGNLDQATLKQVMALDID